MTKDNQSKKRIAILWLMLVACMFEFAFSITAIFLNGAAKTLFIVLLIFASVLVIMLSILSISYDKKLTNSFQQKINEEQKKEN